MQPLVTLSPGATFFGRLSPVRALVLRLVSPRITMPSMGTFSPGCTTITVPTSTDSGATCSIYPLLSMLA